MAPLKPDANVNWSQSLVDAEKAKIKEELDQASQKNEPHSRLRYATQMLAGLSGDDSSLGRLRQYIYAVSALVQHERIGGLSSRDVNDLVTLAYAILQAQGIKPRASRLASLYGDVHLIPSQIFRKEGNPWRAAWEQQVALQLAGNYPSGGLGFQILGMANRALRLGHTHLARCQFQEAESHGLSETLRQRCLLGMAQTHWWSGEATETSDVLAQIDLVRVPPEFTNEVAWIRLCMTATQDWNLNPILKAVRHGGSHHDATYIIEACLWARAIESREFLERLPSMPSLRRNKTLRPQRHGAWFDCATVLQECYDYQIPLPYRIRALSQLVERRHELITVDKEILLLAAATRWLARAKATSLAVLMFSEYRALCMRLTNGLSIDVYNLLSDLRSRPWLAHYFSAPSTFNTPETDIEKNRDLSSELAAG